MSQKQPINRATLENCLDVERCIGMDKGLWGRIRISTNWDTKAELSLKISRESCSGTYCSNVCWQLRKLEHGSFTGHAMYF